MDSEDQLPEELHEEEAKEEFDQTSQSEYQTLANGYLNPRHRRFCQLAAEGRSPAQIGQELGYVSSRVSVLLRNPTIAAEISRLQNRIFEESILDRLKGMSEDALNHLHSVLNDRTNRVRTSEKNDVAKWIIEMQKSKAPQMHDIGENMLSVFMDKLDAQKTAKIPERVVEGEVVETTAKALPAPAPKEKDPLEEWVAEFCASDED